MSHYWLKQQNKKQNLLCLNSVTLCYMPALYSNGSELPLKGLLEPELLPGVLCITGTFGWTFNNRDITSDTFCTYVHKGDCQGILNCSVVFLSGNIKLFSSFSTVNLKHGSDPDQLEMLFFVCVKATGFMGYVSFFEGIRVWQDVQKHGTVLLLCPLLKFFVLILRLRS